jgi:hypothetical protein
MTDDKGIRPPQPKRIPGLGTKTWELLLRFVPHLDLVRLADKASLVSTSPGFVRILRQLTQQPEKRSRLTSEESH